MKLTPYLIYSLILWLVYSHATAETMRLRMATTTSTENSGLLKELNPPFERQFNIELDVLSVGTGKAIRLAKNGDVDLVLVHAPKIEQQLIAEGYGIERQAVMYNDFVIVGPLDDPLGISQLDDINNIMQKFTNGQHTFISRGDDSGTHKKEQELWQLINATPSGKWYLSIGQSMGSTLTITNHKQAYTLSDRGTYLAYKDKVELKVVFERGDLLFNPYHIIIVNPAIHKHVKVAMARRYSGYIRSAEGQNVIRNFRVNGEQLFHPNATP